jgi:WD40 repeat protein
MPSSFGVSQEEGYIFFDREERGHSGIITDLQMSPDGTYFITSSKDKSSKVSRILEEKAKRKLIKSCSFILLTRFGQ